MHSHLLTSSGLNEFVNGVEGIAKEHEDPICKNCGQALEFTRGQAFTGWVHRSGHLICEGQNGQIATLIPKKLYDEACAQKMLEREPWQIVMQVRNRLVEVRPESRYSEPDKNDVESWEKLEVFQETLLLEPDPVIDIDELKYRSYRHNRRSFPEVEPARWWAIGLGDEEYEARFQVEGLDTWLERRSGCFDSQS